MEVFLDLQFLTEQQVESVTAQSLPRLGCWSTCGIHQNKIF